MAGALYRRGVGRGNADPAFCDGYTAAAAGGMLEVIAHSASPFVRLRLMPSVPIGLALS